MTQTYTSDYTSVGRSIQSAPDSRDITLLKSSGNSEELLRIILESANKVSSLN